MNRGGAWRASLCARGLGLHVDIDVDVKTRLQIREVVRGLGDRRR